MKIGENLRKIRTDRGLSQGKLAQSLGVSRSIISQYENNSKIPSLPTAKQMADELGCKLDDFFDGGESRKAV